MILAILRCRCLFVERQDAIECLPIVQEGGCLIDILTEEGAQVLDDLFRRLGETAIDAELDECCNRRSRVSLEVEVLLVLEQHIGEQR